MTEICQTLLMVSVAYGQERIQGGRMRGKLKQNLFPDPNLKFCDFPNLEAQILPKLRGIVLSKTTVFSCDQNFSSNANTTAYSALMLTESEYR